MHPLSSSSVEGFVAAATKMGRPGAVSATLLSSLPSNHARQNGPRHIHYGRNVAAHHVPRKLHSVYIYICCKILKHFHIYVLIYSSFSGSSYTVLFAFIGL